MSVPTESEKIPPELSRFVIVGSGCWEWQGYVMPNGYGRCGAQTGTRLAHRRMYLLLVGEIQPGLVIDHLCRNRRCVNPLHLEPVTMAENLRRGDVGGYQREWQACSHGHEFTPDNTYRYGDKRGCKECRRRRTREWMRKARNG